MTRNGIQTYVTTYTNLKDIMLTERSYRKSHRLSGSIYVKFPYLTSPETEGRLVVAGSWGHRAQGGMLMVLVSFGAGMENEGILEVDGEDV